MTEYYNVDVSANNSKRNKPAQTKKEPTSTGDIEVFGGGYTPGKGPLKPEDKGIPSIFKGDFDFKPKLPWEDKKKNQPPIPYMTPEMRKEYDERTILGIFQCLTVRSISKENSQELYEKIHQIDSQNYKLVFRSFEEAGISLSDVINKTPHLSNTQKKECLEQLVDLGKRVADYGQQRSDDVIPKMKDLIKKYDNNNGLDEVSQKRLSADFKKIINRSDTLQTEAPERPNGRVDKAFRQGNTGDCWLLAGIKSLSLSEGGRKIVDNAVKIDSKGNAVVTLKGVGKKYTITARDLKCSNELSSGDSDVRALEIAMDRYFRETVPEGSADIDGNSVGKALKLLGDPNKTAEYYGRSNVLAVVANLAQTGMKDKAAVTGMSAQVNPSDISAVNEKGEKVKMFNSHAYSIKSVNRKYVELINPHDTSHTIRVPINQYLSHFNLIGVTDTSGLK